MPFEQLTIISALSGVLKFKSFILYISTSRGLISGISLFWRDRSQSFLPFILIALYFGGICKIFPLNKLMACKSSSLEKSGSFMNVFSPSSSSVVDV